MAYKQILSGRYLLRRCIASGGQASVWSADDRKLGRSVAVKVISEDAASRPGVIERFRREAVAAAGLVHPNIAQVYDSGRDDGVYYIVMELLEGGSLRDIERIRTLDQTEASVVGHAIAVALAYAHSKGIVHRDVKPSNVLFTQSGFPKLADFGIARSLESGTVELTSHGEMLGTLSYMAPEQIRGDRIGKAADIYCLGLVLFEALSGENPRSGSGLAELTAKAASPLPSISERLPSLDPEIARLIDQCLSPDPSSRPATASQIAQVLSPHRHGMTELDLSAFAGPAEGLPTVVPASPAVPVGPPALPSVPPSCPQPSTSSATPDVPQTAEGELSTRMALRAESLRSMLRLALALGLSALFAWAGFRLGGSLSASLVRLLPSGIPWLNP